MPRFSPHNPSLRELNMLLIKDLAVRYGAIEALNAAGGGACFTVRLPLGGHRPPPPP